MAVAEDRELHLVKKPLAIATLAKAGRSLQSASDQASHHGAPLGNMQQG